MGYFCCRVLELDCRFCSLVSKANGQDPIGSVGTYHQWLIAEIPHPWPTTIWQAHPIVAPVLERVKTLHQRGVSVRPLMIAPDREYSCPDFTRILYYRICSVLFAVGSLRYPAYFLRLFNANLI